MKIGKFSTGKNVYILALCIKETFMTDFVNFDDKKSHGMRHLSVPNFSCDGQYLPYAKIERI